jgi:hypothetical protein
MASPPPTEFGKRKPAPIPAAASPPVKRSSHVALLLTGTLAVGGSAYALMPRENCQPNGGPGMTAPASPEAAAACASRGSSWSGSHGGSSAWWSHSNFYSGGSSSSGTSAASGSTETTRGGFGGFARAFAAHFSGS